MALDFLTPHQGIPYEREHEGWICERIVEYFQGIGVRAKVWAVGSRAERQWPADEHGVVDGKIFGLQFKRPEPPRSDQRPTSFDQLRWPIDVQSHQYRLVQQRSEVFYLLPTMLNRNYRRMSLHHCIIWRPTRCYKGPTLSYQEAKFPWWSTSPAGIDGPANFNVRWGEFVEQVQECPFGYRIKDGTSGSAYLNSILEWQQQETGDLDEESVLFLVNVSDEPL